MRDIGAGTCRLACCIAIGLHLKYFRASNLETRAGDLERELRRCDASAAPSWVLPRIPLVVCCFAALV